jgi:arylsulfatase A-like enzyme
MPWQVPAKYYDMFPIESIKLPEVPADDLADVPAAGVKIAKPQGDHATMLRTDNWPYAVQAYLASIAFADAQVGRLLDAFDKSEYADNTIVILWGDHGWHLGEKQHWRKFALWEEATRAPLMMTVPGMTKPGGVCERTVEFIHIYPTLAELCGLTPPKNLDGKSFVSLLKDPKSKWDAAAVTTHGKENHAVRSEKWRYIRYADGSEELYDHETDPNEWTNLATVSKYRDTIEELRSYLPKTNAKDAAKGNGGEEGDEPPARRRNAGKRKAASK